MNRHERVARQVLNSAGRCYSEEIGIRLRDKPSPLYCWQVAATLFSARIGAPAAVSAARALLDAGWRTPQRMLAAGWAARTQVLNGSGYARYDESTSRMLGDSAAMLIEDYRGDLRRLRAAAEFDPLNERRRLTAFKGIGPVGADIFFREVQMLWDEQFPFADARALRAAAKLDLPADATALAGLVDRADFARLLSGLVRLDLDGRLEEIRRSPGHDPRL